MRFRAFTFMVCLLAASPALATDPVPVPTAMVRMLGDSVQRAREQVFPTLVHIRPVFDHAVRGRNRELSSTGSGVIISRDGLVVTNFHVAGTAKRLICTLADRRQCRADRIGADAATDLTLIKLRLEELGLDSVPYASLDTKSRPEAGAFVMAMGSPLGLTRSLSLGVVSCPDRFLKPMTISGHIPTGLFNTWIQTDAAINPGNSGGPLVDLEGLVVGINTRAYRGADNLGFSIPASVVGEVVSCLLESGQVPRSRIGITCQALGEMKGYFLEEGGGVLVASVESGSPAEAAGIRPGDVLRHYAGRSVSATFEEDLPGVRRFMASVRQGSKIEVGLCRDGREMSVSLSTEPWRQAGSVDRELPEWGLTLRRLSGREIREQLEDGEVGVLVTGVRPGGAASQTTPPLEEGDVILAVGDVETSSPEQAEGVLTGALQVTDGVPRIVYVRRGFGDFLLALPIRGKESP